MTGAANPLVANRCSECLRPFADREYTFVGVDKRKRTRVVGSCCFSRLRKLLGFGLYLAYGGGRA